MGGGEGTKWRQLLDEKQASGPKDVEVQALFVPAEDPVDGRNVTPDEVVDLLAEEGVLLAGRPGGGGGGIEGLMGDPTTVATITIVFAVTKTVVEKLIDGLLSAVGEEAFGEAKRALKRLAQHQARQLSGARTAISIESPGSGFISITLPTPTTDEAWQALQSVSIPPLSQSVSYEIEWDDTRRRWVLLLPDAGPR